MLGLRTNLAFSVLSVIAGAVIVVCAVIGRNLDHYIYLGGGVVFMLVGMLLTGVSRLSVVNEHLHAITDENNVEAREAKDIRSETAQVALVIRDLIIATDSTG